MGRRGLDTRPAEPRDRRADRRGRTAAHEAHGRARQRGPRRNGRGGIVDEAALAEALACGTIDGAALDVFAGEPPAADSPLLHLPDPDRLLVSPHNAWSPHEAVGTLVEGIVRNIRTHYAE